MRAPSFRTVEIVVPDSFYRYELRSAGACIHTHSQHAVMATLLWKGDEFRCSHLEMIKGMRIAGYARRIDNGSLRWTEYRLLAGLRRR